MGGTDIKNMTAHLQHSCMLDSLSSSLKIAMLGSLPCNDSDLIDLGTDPQAILMCSLV